MTTPTRGHSMHVLTLRLLAAACLCASQASTARADLPPASAVLEGVAERHRRFEEAINDYTYDQEVTEEQLDAKGAVRSRRTRRYEVFFVKGHRVRRLVAEDGVPLAADRQAKVDRDAQKQVRKLLAGREKERSGVRLSDVLDRYAFRTVGTERVADRLALVLDFTPHPGKRDLDHDNVLRRLAGRIWVDEAERVVVRSEVRNLDNIKMALGLGANIRAVALTTEFAKVDDTIWLPRRLESRVEGRVLLLKGVRTRSQAVFSGYRRFGTATEEQLR